jgi:hypothetical protein
MTMSFNLPYNGIAYRPRARINLLPAQNPFATLLRASGENCDPHHSRAAIPALKPVRLQRGDHGTSGAAKAHSVDL